MEAHMIELEPVIAACQKAAQLHCQLNDAYRQLTEILRERPDDDAALRQGDALADALAKLECATQCIRDILPDGTDPEQACDIELRFVFALERDVRRLVTAR